MRETTERRSQSCGSGRQPCEHLTLMQQAMNDAVDHDTELASVRQLLAEKEAQVLSFQEKRKDSESRELDRARNMRWWMERALKYKLDYELDSDVFHKARDQFSRVFEAVDIARRESSAAQQEVIALSRETGEYYKIIQEILKDPKSIDADSIHDRMGKCLTLTRRAQQDRSEAVEARVEEAGKYDSIVLDTNAIQKVFLEENQVREKHMRSKDYEPNSDIEASIATASRMRPPTLTANVPTRPGTTVADGSRTLHNLFPQRRQSESWATDHFAPNSHQRSTILSQRHGRSIRGRRGVIYRSGATSRTTSVMAESWPTASDTIEPLVHLRSGKTRAR